MTLTLAEFFIICGSLFPIGKRKKFEESRKILMSLIKLMNSPAFLLLEIINWSKIVCSFGSNHNLVPSTYSNTDDEFDRESLIEEIKESYELPLNIITRQAVVIELCESLRWNGYAVPPIAMTMSNTGETVVINGFWTRGLIPNVCGGPLRNSYSFQSISLRWGASNQLGSEHCIDDIEFPFEAQLLHVKNSTKDEIIDESVEDVSATIISYLFQIKENNNSQLDPIVMNLCRIQEPNAKVYIPPFQLDTLFPLFERKFYTYNDKLNQPSGKVATWIIYPEPLSLSAFQMEKFRNIFKQNSRHMQTFKERDLYYHE